jgi:NTE family protein
MGGVGAMAESISKMMLGNWSSEKVSANLNAMSQWISPYQSNPLDINPLRKLLQAEIDFTALAGLQTPKVFVSATHVTTGQAKIFSGKRLTLQAVMASSCLPTFFQTVEIDGQPYWDGGFSSNPALLPLINECSSRDIIVVQINPLRRANAPQTPHDIMDRVNELTFNASLLSQMRAIDFINRLLADGRLQEGAQYKSLLLHRIDGGEALENLPTRLCSKSCLKWARTRRNAGWAVTLRPWASRVRSISAATTLAACRRSFREYQVPFWHFAHIARMQAAIKIIAYT